MYAWFMGYFILGDLYHHIDIACYCSEVTVAQLEMDFHLYMTNTPKRDYRTVSAKGELEKCIENAMMPLTCSIAFLGKQAVSHLQEILTVSYAHGVFSHSKMN